MWCSSTYRPDVKTPVGKAGVRHHLLIAAARAVEIQNLDRLICRNLFLVGCFRTSGTRSDAAGALFCLPEAKCWWWLK